MDLTFQAVDELLMLDGYSNSILLSISYHCTV